jgi:hypothetical protein
MTPRPTDHDREADEGEVGPRDFERKHFVPDWVEAIVLDRLGLVLAQRPPPSPAPRSASMRAMAR